MCSKYIVYGLVDPRDGLVHYVGFSRTGMRRPRHCAALSKIHKGETPKHRWLLSLRSDGIDHQIVVLESFDVEADGYPAETRWIKKLRAAGAPLTNSTDAGGRGSGRNPSAEMRAKMSASHEGIPRPEISPEGRQRRIDKLKGRPLSEEHRQALRDAIERRRAEGRLSPGPETRAKSSAASKAMWERRARSVVDKTTGITYRTQTEAASAMGVTRAAIGHAIYGISESCKGHIFAFADGAK